MIEPKILPLSPGSLTVDFGNEISIELNDRVIALATWFGKKRFPGFVEAAPAYSSVAIFYDLPLVRRSFPQFGTGFEAVKSLIRQAVRDLSQQASVGSRIIEIPVDFDGGAAPDLELVAEERGLSTSEVIEIFVSRTYRVFMLGFLPGFAYMGEVDKRINVRRKKTPRTRVPKGSVGIAGRQTGVYPLESPGGWQIIGRTPLEMFTPDAQSPALLEPGDTIRFVAM
jgi:inhibitor of KinA